MLILSVIFFKKYNFNAFYIKNPHIIFENNKQPYRFVLKNLMIFYKNIYKNFSLNSFKKGFHIAVTITTISTYKTPNLLKVF